MPRGAKATIGRRCLMRWLDRLSLVVWACSMHALALSRRQASPQQDPLLLN